MGAEAIVFDLDGTLLNTLDDIADSANCALEANGFPSHPTEAFRHYVGEGVKNLFKRALPKSESSEAAIAACVESFQVLYSDRWHVQTKPYPGVPELLDELSEIGLPITVLSNKPDDFTKQCVNRFFPEWRFSMVLGHRENRPLKPHPAGARHIAATLGVAGKDILFLGDSGVDMRTALASGMIPIGASWGFRSTKELLENGARAVISHPLELLQWAI